MPRAVVKHGPAVPGTYAAGTDADAEQVEGLQLYAKAIRVSEYLTALPPLPMPRDRLHQAMENAREQAARRPPEPDDSP